jgi:hypothetical protein
MHKLKDAPECAGVNSSSGVELLKKCDGVVSPWQAWHNSEAPPQVSPGQQSAPEACQHLPWLRR